MDCFGGVVDMKKRFFAVIIVALILLYIDLRFNTKTATAIGRLLWTEAPPVTNRFAVYSCSTPSNSDQRQFDYVFYLPLTALAWQRLGIRSLVLLIGNRTQWTDSPLLSFVLGALEGERNAKLIFIDAPVENSIFISQNSRLFVSHMGQFDGTRDDVLITSDADIWPLRRQHFVPDEPYDLLLVNSRRAGRFQHENRTYDMQAISCIAASVRTWRQLIPHAPIRGNYSETILRFLQDRFGPTVRQQVRTDMDEWYTDQKLVSLNIYNWSRAHPRKKVLRMVEDGFFRVDRGDWDGDWINREEFQESVDSHLLLNGYQPRVWHKIQPLIHLMYGNDSWQTRWCNQYRQRFHQLFQNMSTS